MSPQAIFFLALLTMSHDKRTFQIIIFDKFNIFFEVNSLNGEVVSELEVAINSARDNPAVRAAVLISGKPGCFIAGADIGMLEKMTSEEEVRNIAKEGQRILNNVESMSKPVVAAIQGACLGGGLEVCTFSFFPPLAESFIWPERMARVNC